MRPFWLTLASLALSAMAQATEVSIEGVYLADDQAHKIELFLRKSVLCGRIAWTRDATLTDKNNPDLTLRARKVAGIGHLHGFSRSADGAWVGGELYNPENGTSYRATIRLDGNDRLVIQGRPNVPLVGGLLGAIFGGIAYTRVSGR